ncbi:DJ-1/PfpI family protein, partial [Amycolatopsis sp. NPDC004169]|uniref:GlxA family transcriptional regulator n=1 Tax=Amycolatopsis sp. NPDC004169 TaxID=3154453 RepID=UPI0033AFCD3A
MRTVVFVLNDNVALPDVAGPLEVFARAGDFGAGYRAVLVSPTGAPVTTTSFTRLGVDTTVAAAPASIDTLVVPGGSPPRPAGNALPELVARARRTAALGTGVLALAEVGVLDGRRVTTHWAHRAELVKRHPALRVERDALFVRDGPFVTGAGATAGVDLALALVEEDHGREFAARVARLMVVFLCRPGEQPQFSVWARAAAVTSSGVRAVVDTVALDPAGDHSNAALAVRAAVSERHLVRMFRDELGITPAVFVELTRLEAAKVLLLTTDASQETVARRVGFGSPETMRRTFHRQLAVSPGVFRSRSRPGGPGGGGAAPAPPPTAEGHLVLGDLDLHVSV